MPIYSLYFVSNVKKYWNCNNSEIQKILLILPRKNYGAYKTMGDMLVDKGKRCVTRLTTVHSSSYKVACTVHILLTRPQSTGWQYVVVVASAHWLQIFSTSARRDVLLSAIGRLLLPALDFGTVYLLTSDLPHHSQHFVRSWKLIYFGNLTQTLCYNCVAIVVLEVTLT